MRKILKKQLTLGAKQLITKIIVIANIGLFAQAGLDSGLVALYQFNGNAIDESGNGNDGTVNGATLTEDRFGNLNSAYSFDGIDDFIDIPDDPALNPNSYTLVAWFLSDMESEGRILTKESMYQGNQRYSLILNTAPTDNPPTENVIELRFDAGNTGFPGPVYAGTQTPYNHSEWHQVVGIFNDPNDLLSLYVDGLLVDTTVTDYFPQNSENPLTFGRFDEVEGRYFNGLLDDIRIYNRTLTTTEIDSLYHEGGWDTEPENGLVAYYPFNGNANDESGNGNNGTVNGVTLTEDRFGNANNAYDFDGIDDYIQISNSNIFNIQDEITVSYWVKLETSAPYYYPYTIIDKHGSWGSGQRDFDIHFGLNGVASNIYSLWHTGFIPETFYQFVITYNGSSAKWYENGIIIDSVIVSDNIPLTTSDIWIGEYSLGGNYYFDGIIDDIRIYNRALSTSEIDSLYHLGGWPIDSAENLIQNPGFEDGLNDWDPYQYSSGWSASTANPHSGLSYAEFNFPGGSGYYDASIKQTGDHLYVNGGIPYFFSFWRRETDTHDTHTTSETILDASLKLNGVNYSHPMPNMAPSSTWIQIDTTITFPESGYVYIDFQLHGYATSNNAVFALDDVVLRRLENQELDTVLFFETFNNDVFSDGSWVRSDASVIVDTTNEWLHIGSDGSVDDYAEITLNIPFPVTLESRMRLVSGGQNYRLPNMWLYYGTGAEDRIQATYLNGDTYGWSFNGWTNIHTNAPNGENQWMTIKEVINTDGGTLFAKSDYDSVYTFITNQNWTIPDTLIKLRYTQPWDAICEIDYVTIRGISPNQELTTLSIPELSAVIGDTVLIPINIQFYNYNSFNSAQISLGGYQTGLDFVQVVTDSSLSGDAGWTYAVNETDSLLLTWSAGAQDISGSGVFCWLKFAIIGDICTFAPITIESVMFNTGEDLVATINGGINIYPVPIFGDVDENGQIQAFDASTILRYIVGYDSIGCQGLANADVTANDTVTSRDASVILEYGVGNISELPFTDTLNTTGNITINDGFLIPGTQLDIDLNLFDGSNILSFEGQISYNPDYLEFQMIQWSNMVQGFLTEWKENEGVINFAGAGSEPDGANGVFGIMRFNVIQTGSTFVSMDRIRWNEEPIVWNATSAIFIPQLTTGENIQLPTVYALYQNYPNPFNPSATIRYDLPEDAFVRITIYDLLGRQIVNLVNEDVNAGYCSTIWNGTDSFGKPVGSGMYIYQIRAGSFIQSKKMVLLK
ncbi:MAG: T9SS type A sorting domain-containing protein [Planctomycetia bacterium]|nr:T9SS type A sorting domain-containing protein [Planctomycetia bacterium]